jgi:hypothetical protein
MAVPRAPAAAGLAALLLSAPIYLGLQQVLGDWPYLHRMLITFVVLLGIMGAITAARPLAEPRRLPVRVDMDMRTSPLVMACGAAVIAAVVAFFVVFR